MICGISSQAVLNEWDNAPKKPIRYSKDDPRSTN